MNCIVTAGPAYEPLDDVRRLTNFSTGRLGTELANYLAARGHNVHLLLGEQALVVLSGLSAGAAGVLLLTRFLSTWLFGVSPTDRLTLIAGAICLATITAAATLIPARRATGIDPMRALRHE